MKRIPLSVPEIVIVGATRGALGAGVALLLADLMKPSQRKAVGWTLFAVGALSTIPIAIELFRSHEEKCCAEGKS